MAEAAIMQDSSPTPAGNSAQAGQLTLRQRHDATVVVALAAPSATGAASEALEQAARRSAMGLRRSGPARWLLVGQAPGDTVVAAVTAACGDMVAAIDQCSGRVVMTLSGAPVREALAKGTAVDLHPLTFGPGSSAATLFGHINVQLTCLEPDAFEIVVMRSYARSLVEDLDAMCAEFGLVTESE